MPLQTSRLVDAKLRYVDLQSGTNRWDLNKLGKSMQSLGFFRILDHLVEIFFLGTFGF